MVGAETIQVYDLFNMPFDFEDQRFGNGCEEVVVALDSGWQECGINCTIEIFRCTAESFDAEACHL